MATTLDKSSWTHTQDHALLLLQTFELVLDNIASSFGTDLNINCDLIQIKDAMRTKLEQVIYPKQ